MTELFLRKAVVSVGPKAANTISSIQSIFGGSIGTSYDGFRVTFDIEKTYLSSPNHAKISIYNLKKSSRAALEQGGTCFLEAGYTGLGGSDPIVSQIYIGDILRTYVERNGPDLVTTLECLDAGSALREAHVEQAFGPGTTYAQVIGYLTQQLGLSIGNVVPATGVFQHGISISGLVSDALDHVTKAAGLEWHVTDGEVNVLDPDVPLDQTPIYVARSTGLIGFPSKTLDNLILFKSLLNPQIKPGVPVLLNSDTYNGLVNCKVCKFRGDTHGGEFSVSVEAGAL